MLEAVEHVEDAVRRGRGRLARADGRAEDRAARGHEVEPRVLRVDAEPGVNRVQRADVAGRDPPAGDAGEPYVDPPGVGGQDLCQHRRAVGRGCTYARNGPDEKRPERALSRTVLHGRPGRRRRNGGEGQERREERLHQPVNLAVRCTVVVWYLWCFFGGAATPVYVYA